MEEMWKGKEDQEWTGRKWSFLAIKQRARNLGQAVKILQEITVDFC